MNEDSVVMAPKAVVDPRLRRERSMTRIIASQIACTGTRCFELT